jgi:hypothetical protein
MAVVIEINGKAQPVKSETLGKGIIFPRCGVCSEGLSGGCIGFSGFSES